MYFNIFRCLNQDKIPLSPYIHPPFLVYVSTSDPRSPLTVSPHPSPSRSLLTARSTRPRARETCVYIYISCGSISDI